MEDDIEGIKKILEILQRRLQILKEKRAYYGVNCPPEVIMEIEDISKDIKYHKGKLKLLRPPTTISGDDMSILSRKPDGRKIIQYIGREVSLRQSNKRPISLIYLDLDNFSKVENRFGPEVADAVIKEVKRVHESVVSVNKEYFFTRWNEDEFVTCLYDTVLDEAQRLAERVRSSMQRFDWSSISPGLFVKGSFGIAQFSSSESIEEWITRAILGSKSAKKVGGNKVKRAPLKLPPDIPPKPEMHKS